MQRTNETLKELQNLTLDEKIEISKERIREWYEYWLGNVYVSTSGGKDSTVLLHLVRSIYPDVPAVFVNTGLEDPSVQHFARNIENVTVVHAKKTFKQVLTEYGYPLVSKEVADAIFYARKNPGIRRNLMMGLQNLPSNTPKKREKRKRTDTKRQEFLGIMEFEKPAGGIGKTGIQKRAELLATGERGKSQFNKEKWLPLVYTPFRISAYCCDVMKKTPAHGYMRESKRMAYLGTMASESRMRRQGWIRTGCNAFESVFPKSTPLAFWTENDVLEYIQRYNLPIAEAYGEVIKTEDGYNTTGVKRTGCLFLRIWCSYWQWRDTIPGTQADVPKAVGLLHWRRGMDR